MQIWLLDKKITNARREGVSQVHWFFLLILTLHKVIYNLFYISSPTLERTCAWVDHRSHLLYWCAMLKQIYNVECSLMSFVRKINNIVLVTTTWYGPSCSWISCMFLPKECSIRYGPSPHHMLGIPSTTGWILYECLSRLQSTLQHSINVS